MFNVMSTGVTDNETGDDCEEYAIYKAATPGSHLPFKEWVKTATCRYCKNVGHIRPDCRKRKSDVRRGVHVKESPTVPSPSPPSSDRPRLVTQRLRDHPQFKALKAAFDMVNNQDDLDLSDEAHAAILDKDVSDLMCALGLKE